MTIEQQQELLAYLGYYQLRRKDGTVAIDGIPGPSMVSATRSFQNDVGLNIDGDCGPATQKALRHAVAYGIDRPKGEYKWVNPEDFKCRCGGKYCNGWPAQPHEKTLKLLDRIGEHFQRRIQPHSGCRCKQWNAKWGGASNSQHLYGAAMDFHLEGIPHYQVYQYADQILGNSGGLGIYDWGIHIDDRAQKSRWDRR